MRAKIILLLIIVLASFLRFWSITSFPPGFSADEATVGYNAYSISKTGRDEYGELFPLAFRAFSDYQAPLYTYITVPFIATLGLNELAVRLPSAIFGVGTVLIVFFLITRLFNNSTLGLFASFFVAISPFHVFFSRGAWQTNLATFFITLGIYLFILGLERGKYLPFSVLVFLASLYAYQSPRLIIPLLGVLLILFYGRQLLNHKKPLIISAILGLILVIPMVFILLGPAGQARFKGVSVFSDPGPVNRINQLRGEHFNLQGIVPQIFHNKPQTFATIIAKNHLEHFGPDFLFIRGDPIGRHNIPQMGVMYLFGFIFLPLGIIFALRKEKIGKSKIIFLWLILAPLASALTFQSPNALRAANMAVPLSIFSGFGVYWLLSVFWDKGKYLRIVGSLLVGVVVIFFMVKFLHQYYVHLPQRYALEWEYGFGEMLNFVERQQSDFTKVVITNRYDQPYILTLFYLKYDPKTYQTTPKEQTAIDEFGFTTISSFDKYEFREINWEEDQKLRNTLIIGTAEEVPKNVKILDQVLNPDGSVAFKIVER